MGMGFAPTWLRQVSPLLHKTTLTTGIDVYDATLGWRLQLRFDFELTRVRLLKVHSDVTR